VVVRGERMKKSRIVYLSLVIATLTIGLIAATGIRNVSATDTPRIYISPAAYAGPYGTGQVLTLQVLIDSSTGYGAPHETSESAVDSDKTWAWEVIIEFDPEVVTVTTVPTRHPTRDWFDCFHKWYWDDLFMEWLDEGSYDNSFAKSVDNDAGLVSAWCGLTEDPTTIPIPTGSFPFPNAGLHSGSYMDLPYTDGISTSGLESPPGSWAGDYFLLYYFRVTTLVPIEGSVYSNIHIKEARLWCYDGKTLYPADTEDGVIGLPPSPEFPLGLEIVMMVTAAVPIVYIWRLRKRVHKKVL
jgi:hypothetical protein